jgi:hypothetical protein
MDRPVCENLYCQKENAGATFREAVSCRGETTCVGSISIPGLFVS